MGWNMFIYYIEPEEPAYNPNRNDGRIETMTMIYGRFETFCPGCGSLNQTKIKDILFEDGLIVESCSGCQIKYEIKLPAPAPVDDEGDAPVVDDTPQEKIDELAEKTRTRVTPKSLSRNVKTKTRELKKEGN